MIALSMRSARTFFKVSDVAFAFLPRVYFGVLATGISLSERSFAWSLFWIRWRCASESSGSKSSKMTSFSKFVSLSTLACYIEDSSLRLTRDCSADFWLRTFSISIYLASFSLSVLHSSSSAFFCTSSLSQFSIFSIDSFM